MLSVGNEVQNLVTLYEMENVVSLCASLYIRRRRCIQLSLGGSVIFTRFKYSNHDYKTKNLLRFTLAERSCSSGSS